MLSFKNKKSMGNKIYPIGIQNFESLRLDGYFYIDKTALIYQLVKSGRYLFPEPPTPLRKKPAYLHSGSLFPREKGTFSRTG